METKRTRRIGNQIRQVLSDILLHDLRDPRITDGGVVSITHVAVAPDLRTARVFLSTTEDGPEKRTNLLEGFRSAGRYLRGEVGRKLKLRRVPELRFELDDTLSKAWNIERTLKQVAVKPPSSPSDEPTSRLPDGPSAESTEGSPGAPTDKFSKGPPGDPADERVQEPTRPDAAEPCGSKS